MSSCCVSGCKNRHSSGSKLKFYRIPSGKGPFRKNRRRLWLQAIQQVNGSTEGLKGNVRVCGAHFISGEASMDHDNPDFVPSVFECTNLSPKIKRKWASGCRKNFDHKANEKEREETSPRGDSPLEDQPALLMEEPQTPSSSSLLTEEAFTELDETENESQTIESETTSSPLKESTSFKVPANIPNLGKMVPTVLLKSVFAPAGGYQCEQCSQIFTTASQLVKHKVVHEGERPCISEVSGELSTSQADIEFEDAQEPSFSCNICDRSFTTSQNLKRHKLLHVRDGRKCHKCGVLFCRLHNHILYLPQVKSEEESPAVETVLVKTEQNQFSDLEVDAQSTMTITQMQTATPPKPKLEVRNPLPPASHTRIITKIPVPTLKIASMQRVAHRNSKKVHPPCIQRHLPQNLELPPRLKVFSPKHLTSALLQVERDYDYILEKAKKCSNDLVIMKKEPHELPMVSSDVQDKKELIAYDLEVVI